MNIETILARPSVRGIELRQGIEAFAHKVGSSLNLSNVVVYWSRDVQTAGINSYGELYLSNIQDDAIVNRAVVLKYAGYVVHELLHHKYTDFSAVAGAQNDYVKALHNAVEDGWIENKAIKSGLLGNIGALLGELIDGMSRNALASVTDWNDARQYPFILAVACRAHATVKIPCNPRLTGIFTEAAKRCVKANSSTDTLRIAEWVYEQIKQASEQPEQKKPKDGPPKPQDGPASPSKSKDEGQGADGAKEPSAPSNDPGAPGAPDAPVDSPVGKGSVEVEPTLDENGGAYGTYSKDAHLRSPLHCIDENRDAIAAGLPTPANLRYEVKRLFENSGTSEFSRNRKAGSINVHALSSVATGSDRVFKRRLDVEGIDSAVVITLDLSGSMFKGATSRPDLITPAVQTCRALIETLSAAGVSTAIIAFGSNIYEIKPFNMPHRKASALLSKVKPCGQTNDYSALRYAHEILVHRHESRKIVFAITDGQGNPEAVRMQVKSGHAFGITTIGIGIKTDVSDVYENAVCVDNVADLGSVTFKQIKLAA